MRKSTLSLSVALVATAASSAWLWQALNSERTRSADLAAKLEQRDTELQRVTDDNVRSGDDSAAAPVTVSTTANPAVIPKPAAPVAPVADAQEDWEANQRRLMQDPRYREVLREQERLKLAQRRANFIRLLGFTPEQADAAINLQIDQEWLSRDDSTASDPEAMKARRARYDAAEREHDNKLRALLGEEKRARLQGYMETRESRMQVEDLRSALGEATALRDDQIEPLILALHAERSQAKVELREYRDTLNWDGANRESWQRYAERRIELMKAMDSRMLSSASSLLSQAQLEILRQHLSEELAKAEAQQRMSRIQVKLEQADRAATSPN